MTCRLLKSLCHSPCPGDAWGRKGSGTGYILLRSSQIIDWLAKACKRSLYRDGLFVTSRVTAASRPASKPATPSENTSMIDYTTLCSPNIVCLPITRKLSILDQDRETSSRGWPGLVASNSDTSSFLATQLYSMPSSSSLFPLPLSLFQSASNTEGPMS